MQARLLAAKSDEADRDTLVQVVQALLLDALRFELAPHAYCSKHTMSGAPRSKTGQRSALRAVPRARRRSGN